jgi:hypothetical protein
MYNYLCDSPSLLLWLHHPKRLLVENVEINEVVNDESDAVSENVKNESEGRMKWMKNGNVVRVVDLTNAVVMRKVMS